MIRYVHNNPVKAGITNEPGQYQWSSYQHYINPQKGRLKLVDSEFVLGMLSTDISKSLEEFKYFSMLKDDGKFMDEEDETIKSLKEGQVYLDDYIRMHWIRADRGKLIEDAAIRNQIIAELRSNTQLSIRKIAALLEISRGAVQGIRSRD